MARYDGPGGQHDAAWALAVDNSEGNVYVTGESGGDHATVKYSQGLPILPSDCNFLERIKDLLSTPPEKRQSITSSVGSTDRILDGDRSWEKLPSLSVLIIYLSHKWSFLIPTCPAEYQTCILYSLIQTLTSGF